MKGKTENSVIRAAYPNAPLSVIHKIIRPLLSLKRYNQQKYKGLNIINQLDL